MDWEYLKLRRQLVAEHLAEQGLVCPGWRVAPHPVQHERQLTLDHLIPRSQGGANTRENARILCRSCNSRRGSGPVA